VPLEEEDPLTVGRSPNPHRPVPTRGGEALAVGAEGHARDLGGVPLERTMARGVCPLPIVPLETTTVDAALLTFRPLLVEDLPEQRAVVVFPEPLD
jgi:hypothetical protein